MLPGKPAIGTTTRGKSRGIKIQIFKNNSCQISSHARVPPSLLCNSHRLTCAFISGVLLTSSGRFRQHDKIGRCCVGHASGSNKFMHAIFSCVKTDCIRKQTTNTLLYGMYALKNAVYGGPSQVVWCQGCKASHAATDVQRRHYLIATITPVNTTEAPAFSLLSTCAQVQVGGQPCISCMHACMLGPWCLHALCFQM